MAGPLRQLAPTAGNAKSPLGKRLPEYWYFSYIYKKNLLGQVLFLCIIGFKFMVEISALKKKGHLTIKFCFYFKLRLFIPT